MNTTPSFIGHTPLDFGTRVKDKITGDEGMVVAKFYQISGCTQVMYLNPEYRSNDNIPIRCFAHMARLEILGENKVFDTQPPEESNFKLGEKVTAPAYGITGIVSAICFYPDQATHLEIQPPYNAKEGKLPDCHSIPESMVESLEKPKSVEPTAAASRPSPPYSPMSPRAHNSRGN